MAKEPKTINVFVVEDDEAWSTMVTAKLGKGYNVSHYTKGEDTVTNLHKKPDIVVLDYHLEGQMTGLDTLKEIRKQVPEARVIMFTAQDDVQVAVETLNVGAYDYIVKGENAVHRLKIILRNMQSEEELRREFVELKFKVKRERAALYAVILLILFASFVVYFLTCPESRLISWDPFNMAASSSCMGTTNPCP
jgi:DNA-binding response OmpR family regulator